MPSHVERFVRPSLPHCWRLVHEDKPARFLDPFFGFVRETRSGERALSIGCGIVEVAASVPFPGTVPVGAIACREVDSAVGRTAKGPGIWGVAIEGTHPCWWKHGGSFCPIGSSCRRFEEPHQVSGSSPWDQGTWICNEGRSERKSALIVSLVQLESDSNLMEVVETNHFLGSVPGSSENWKEKRSQNAKHCNDDYQFENGECRAVDPYWMKWLHLEFCWVNPIRTQRAGTSSR